MTHRVSKILAQLNNNDVHTVQPNCTLQDVWPRIKPSTLSTNTTNPIRDIFDNLSQYKIAKNKEFISMAIGDPTSYMEPPASIKNAILKAYKAPNSINGYCHSNGLESARIAISKQYKSIHCTKDDVIITGGCMQALVLCFASLLNPNKTDNILLPSPGWPEYETICKRYDFQYKYYKLMPSKQWQIDIQHLESMVDINTKAILVTNPSNPCGSILTYDTMLKLLKVANKYKIPIISDEIYSNIIFPDGHSKFNCFTTIKQKENITVPILITSGLAKNYVVPGWKVGWIVFDDEYGSLSKVKHGINQMLTINSGPSSICQFMVKYILENTHSEYWVNLNKQLYKQCKLFCDLINKTVPELDAIHGNGSFYVMVKIHIDKFKDIQNDREFFEQLLAEQAVFILPGSIFNMDGYFRAVICPNTDVLTQAVNRLKAFCEKHRH